MADRCTTFSAGSMDRTPYCRNQRKNDLTEVMRRERVLGLHGIPRSFSIHVKKRLSSSVVMLPMDWSGARKWVSKRTSERKALTVLGERPWPYMNISQPLMAVGSRVLPVKCAESVAFGMIVQSLPCD